MLRWTILILTLLLQTACDAPTDKARPDSPLLETPPKEQVAEPDRPEPPGPPETALLMSDTVEVRRFETTATALSTWREFRQARPTLLLLSNTPHLLPVPEELRRQATILIENADAEQLRPATTGRSPSPLLLPGMAVDAALRNAWFRELVWALPLRDPAQELDLERFKTQLAEAGMAAEGEVESFSLHDRTLSGRLRSTPFRAAALPLLQNLDGPVIVHIDLSYFQPLYKNEVSTPLFDIIQQTLVTLQKMRLETAAVTFSYGHLDSEISLDVRFIGEILAWLIKDPARLEQPIPINWQRQRDALYLSNFFQNEKIRELHEAQEGDAPDSGWVKFNLYRVAAKEEQAEKALEYLGEAVARDPLFALEYLELSGKAYEGGRPDEALRMLELASEVFTDDPIIKLQMAQLANELGEKEKALVLLNKLRNLPWSEIYYPQVPEYLSDLTTFVQTGRVPARNEEIDAPSEQPPLPTVNPNVDPSRQRVLHPN